MDELAYMNGSESKTRDELIKVLEFGRWPERRAALVSIAEQYSRSNAAETIAIIDSGPIDLFGRNARSEEESEHQSAAYAELGLVLFRLGRARMAQVICTRALGLAPEGISHARGRAEHVLGTALRDERAWSAAEQHLQLALRVFRRLEERQSAAEVLDTIGGVYLGQLELSEAEYYFRQSLYEKRETRDLAGQAVTLGSLGRIALLRGDYDEALELLYQDQSLAQELGDAHGVAITANQIGEVWLLLGDVDKADRAITAGIDAARRSADDLDAAYALRMVAQIALIRGSAESAWNAASEARIGFAKRESRAGVVRCDIALAAVERIRGATGDAVVRLLEARRIASGDTALEAETCLELSLVYRALGDSTSRRAVLEDGLRLARSVEAPSLRRRLETSHAFLEIGDRLVDLRLIDPTALASLVEHAYRTRRGIGRALIEKDVLTAERLEAFLEQIGIPRISPSKLAAAARADAAALLPRRTAERMLALPLREERGRLWVVMADPLDLQAVGEIEQTTGRVVHRTYAPAAEIQSAIATAWARRRFDLSSAPDGLFAVDRIVEEAVRCGASDIHVEPKREGVRLRLRVDGVLHEVDRVGRALGSQIVSRMKVMSSLDIAERRRPQDGRARWESGGRTRSLRVSTFPTLHGEKIVARLIDQDGQRRLDDVGLDEQSVETIRRLVTRRDGMVLVVGPTGSGKTTTLYAALDEIDPLERSIATVEDPVEYEAEAFAQSQMHPDIGYNFAEALKALLRQDPDVVLLGEMRDLESASIATRLALTGCMVLSTLHAYDTTAAVTRLVEMGVPSYVITAVLRAAVAQRLVRRLCDRCKAPDEPAVDLIRSLDPGRDPREVLERGRFFKPTGCDVCHNLGYRGRLPVFELLEVDTELRTALQSGLTGAALRDKAVSRGLRTIQSSALRRVMAGETSLAEALRVL